MSEIKIADVGWNEFVIESLEEVMERARQVNSDFAAMKTCDGAGCGRMFDARDPRSLTMYSEEYKHDFHFCPGCEWDSQKAAEKSA